MMPLSDMVNPFLPQNKCPHYALDLMSCKLSLDGLYLPVEAHVEAYCLTTRHVSCAHYLASHVTGGVDHILCCEENRRRFYRIAGRYIFHFAGFSSANSMSPSTSDTGHTIDFSSGGIRFESHQNLSVDSLIRFAIQDDFLPQTPNGTGRVAWCRPLENSSLYHAGIVFSDPAYGETMTTLFS